MSAHDRRLRALRLARTIEATEQCPVMKTETVAAIEHALVDYALGRLVAVRAEIGQQVMDSQSKARAVAVVTNAIEGETA